MPDFSAFTGFGFLRFSSAPSEAEKIYDSLRASFRDPRTGQETFDLTEGTYQEAKLYAWALAIAEARVGVQTAGDELKPETSYYQLEAQERRFGVTPGPNDSVADRQAALLARRKLARGPRYEAIVEALQAILGSNFVAYRPISTTEAEAYPTKPAFGPGIFARHDRVAKSVRLLEAASRAGAGAIVSDSYSETFNTNSQAVPNGANTVEIGQAFKGNGRRLKSAKFYLKKTGTPTGSATARIYEHPTGILGDIDYVNEPIGTPLAISDNFDVSTLTTSLVVREITFSGTNRVLLEDGVAYLVSIRYTNGTIGTHTINVGYDNTTVGHVGEFFEVGGTSPNEYFVPDDSVDFNFYVTTSAAQEVAYENWNRNLADIEIVKGDVLCVDPGNWGLADKAVVYSSRTADGVRYFSADFASPHAANVMATTAPVPLWMNSKRHVLVVVKAAAAVDPTLVARVDALLRHAMRAPTSWAIVQATTDGAATLGPFKVGTTLGSPLGAVPVESITI